MNHDSGPRGASDHSRPVSASPLHHDDRSRSELIVAAKASGVPRHTTPASAASISDAKFTSGDTTTGTPAAMASTTEFPKFSVLDGSAQTVASDKAARRSPPRSISIKVT